MSKYSLSKKSQSKKEVEKLFEIDVDFTVNEFCFAGEYGFALVCTNDHIIYHIDPNGRFVPPYYGEPGVQIGCLTDIDNSTANLLSNPNAVECREGTLFVLQDGGRFLSKINILNELWPTSLMPIGRYCQENMDTIVKKCPGDSKVAMAINGKDIVWTIDTLNSCFRYRNCLTKKVIGGKRGYSVNSDSTHSRFDSPRGIFLDGDAIYVSDTNNFCIRLIEGDSISVVAGSPTQRGSENGKDGLLDSPTKIRGVENTLYFLDNENVVKSISKHNNMVSTIGTFEGLISIDVDAETGDLYVLEAS